MPLRSGSLTHPSRRTGQRSTPRRTPSAEEPTKYHMVDVIKYLLVIALAVMGTLWYQRLSMHAAPEQAGGYGGGQNVQKLADLKDFAMMHPKVEKNPNDRAEGFDFVYLDWEYSSDLFSNHNYRSVETALRVYNGSKFAFSIIGPGAAQVYKLGDSMSITTFDKYRKQGYDFKSILFSNFSHKHFGLASPQVMRYWTRALKLCCRTAKWGGRAQDNMHFEVPFHMYTYMRMQQLLKTGGIYSDFSWLHTHRIPDDVTNGFVMLVDESTSAFNPKAKDRFSIGSKKSKRTVLAPHSHARTSMLMVFRDSERAVPRCVLEHYGRANESCIEQTTLAEPELVTLPLNEGPRAKKRRKTIINRLPSPIDIGARRCIAQIVEYCFKTLNIPNQLAQFTATTSVPQGSPTTVSQLTLMPSKRGSVGVVTFGGNGSLAALTLHSPGDSASFVPLSHDGDAIRSHRPPPRIDAEVAAVWMGFGEAYGGLWYTAKQGTVRQLINAYTDSTYAIKNKVANFIMSRNRIRECSSLLNLRASTRNYTAYPSFSLKYLERREVHNLIGVSQSMQVRAQMSTAPTFFIPGFMKAGTTFLHETLARHPQVLVNTAGSGFKETGCYMPIYLGKDVVHERMNCFPFLRANEGFIYGDGTVIYANYRHLPKFMFAENPALKIIFMVREPIELLESQYRFIYSFLVAKGMQDFNKRIQLLLVDTIAANGLQELRDGAVALADAAARNADAKALAPLKEALLAKFFRLVDADPDRDMSMILTLIHYPAILNWVDVFGPKQVRIIPSEALRLPSDLATNASAQAHVRHEWDEIYSFLGLCPYDELPEREIHATKKNVIPEMYALTNESIAIVREYMMPFLALMDRYFGVRYST